MIQTALEAHANGMSMPWLTNIFINNGIVNNVNISQFPTDFDHMRVIILNYAMERHLKKGKGFVYAPIEGCPCAYKEMCTYEKFINLVLKKDTPYLSNPRSFDDLMKFMKNYETDEMPLHEIDLDLLSFSNGILSLSSATFTPYTEIIAHIPRHPLLLSVARHHIDKPYTECSHVTWLSDFEAAFKDCMDGKLTMDRAVLAAFGFSASDHAEYVCKVDDERCSKFIEGRQYNISKVEGHITWLSDFEAAFKDCMDGPLTMDRAVLAAFGFSASEKYENVCKACKQLARSSKNGSKNCCNEYDARGRGKKW
eukprot:gene28519-31677_t